MKTPSNTLVSFTLSLLSKQAETRRSMSLGINIRALIQKTKQKAPNSQERFRESNQLSAFMKQKCSKSLPPLYFVWKSLEINRVRILFFLKEVVSASKPVLSILMILVKHFVVAVEFYSSGTLTLSSLLWSPFQWKPRGGRLPSPASSSIPLT